MFSTRPSHRLAVRSDQRFYEIDRRAKRLILNARFYFSTKEMHVEFHHIKANQAGFARLADVANHPRDVGEDMALDSWSVHVSSCTNTTVSTDIEVKAHIDIRSIYFLGKKALYFSFTRCLELSKRKKAATSGFKGEISVTECLPREWNFLLGIIGDSHKHQVLRLDDPHVYEMSPEVAATIGFSECTEERILHRHERLALMDKWHHT